MRHERIGREHVGAEDLDGLFSGYDAKGRKYDAVKGNWAYEGSEAARKSASGNADHGTHGHGLQEGAPLGTA